MNTFVTAVVGLFAIDLVEKIVRLYRGNTHRPSGLTALDALANVVVLCWGIWVLAGRGA